MSGARGGAGGLSAAMGCSMNECDTPRAQWGTVGGCHVALQKGIVSEGLGSRGPGGSGVWASAQGRLRSGQGTCGYGYWERAGAKVRGLTA